MDSAVQVVGAALAVAYVAWALRGGRPHDPIATIAPPTRGPAFAHVAIVLLSYGLIQQVLLRIFAQGAETPANPGSESWHRLQVADAAARLIVAAAMAGILVLTAKSQRPVRGPRLKHLAIAACAVFPAVLVICLAQAEFSTDLWGRFEPQRQAPQHDLLTAFTNSAWGAWGRAQLAIIAIVVAPLAEELFFRGLLLSAIWRVTGLVWPAIGLSAILFALVHSAYPQTVLPMFTFGVVLGVLRVRTDSLACCALVHALFNGRTMLLVAFEPEILITS